MKKKGSQSFKGNHKKIDVVADTIIRDHRGEALRIAHELSLLGSVTGLDLQATVEALLAHARGVSAPRPFFCDRGQQS